MSSNLKKQECSRIPVECILPAAVAVCWGVCLSACWDTPPRVDLEPPGCGPRDSPGCGPGDPPARPLSFPPGCGPGQTPQAPPGCGPGNLQGMLGYHPPPRIESQTRVKHNLAPTSLRAVKKKKVELGMYLWSVHRVARFVGRARST